MRLLLPAYILVLCLFLVSWWVPTSAWISSKIAQQNKQSWKFARQSFSLRATLPMEGNDDLNNVAVVLLAGGKGKRMKSSMPKQFLPLLGKPVFLRSLDIFRALPDIVKHIVIVLDESYRDEFAYLLAQDSRIRWADPGAERQDSVFNGLNHVPDDCQLVAIHDAARPLVTHREVLECLRDGLRHGAAVLGVPMKGGPVSEVM